MLPLSPATGMFQLMFVLVLGVAIELWLEDRLTRLLRTNPAFPWLWQTLCAPLLRSALLVGGALFAYPALFGFRNAPALGNLLPSEGARFGTLLALVFLARFIVPRVLRLSDRPAVLDAMQGLIAVAVIFSWFADYLGAVSVSLWPGVVASLALLGLCMVMPSLATGLGHDFGARCDQHWATLGLDQLFGKAMGMVAVAPIMTLYGYLLGSQLGI
jgi:hypothetical protein